MSPGDGAGAGEPDAARASRPSTADMDQAEDHAASAQASGPVTRRFTGPHRRRWRLLAVAGLFLVCLFGPAVQIADSRLTVPTAVSILEERDLDLTEFETVRGLGDDYDVTVVDGELYWDFPWPIALAAIPAVLIADVLPGVEPATWSVSAPVETWPVELSTAAALITITGIIVYRTLVEMAVPIGTAAVAACVAVVGTPLMSSGSQALWGQTVAVPFIAAAVLAAVKADRDGALSASAAFASGAWAALAYVMRPTAVALMLPIIAYLALRFPRRIWCLGAGGLAVAVPFFSVNLWQYHALLAPYYDGGKLAVTDEAIPASIGTLISPSRGILWFSPIVVASLVGLRRPLVSRALVTTICVSLFFHWFLITTWPVWWGGSTFGPRLFMETVPLLVVLASGALTSQRGHTPTWLVVVAALSLFINIQGSYVRAGYCWSAVPVPVDQQPSRLWDWSDPQPVRGVRALATNDVGDAISGACDATWDRASDAGTGA